MQTFLIRGKENYAIATKVWKWVDEDLIFTHKEDEKEKKVQGV